MQEILGFGWTQLEDARVVAVLLAVGAFLGRSHLAHWLTRDIEAVKAEHQQALEDKKAQLQQELEAYRTTLIAQAEAVKASQDVKKTLAVKVVEMKFEEIRKLFDAMAGMGKMVNMIEASRQVGLQVDYGQIAALGGSLDGAATRAKPFLAVGECERIAEFATLYFREIGLLQRIHGGRAAGDERQIYDALIAAHNDCESIVYAHMREMMAMG